MATRTISNAGGNWNATTTWVEGAVPAVGDDVVATATSGNVTINVAAFCRSIDLTNYVATLTHNSGVSLIIGTTTNSASNVALKFVSGMTYTRGSTTTSAISFSSTAAGAKTIDTGGKVLGNVTIIGAGASHTLSSALSSSGTFTVSSGSFDTNSFNLSCTSFTKANVAIVTLGTSTLTLTGTWSATSGTGAYSGASATIIMNVGSTSSGSFSGGGQTYGAVTISLPATTQFTMSATNTFASLTVGGPAGSGGSVQLILTATQTITGLFTVNGGNFATRIGIRATTVGTPQTISAGSISTSNSDWTDITAAGTANWDLSAITGGAGDGKGNTGITFTASATQYFMGTGSSAAWASASNWASSSGGAAGSGRMPLPQDDVVIDASTPATGIAVGQPRWCRNLTMTKNIILTTTFGSLVYGSIDISAGSISGSASITMRGGTGTIRGTIAPPLVFWLASNYTLNGSLTCGALSLNGGASLDTAGYTVTTPSLGLSASGTRSLTLGSSVINLTGTSGALISMTASGLTLSATSSSINIVNPSTSARAIDTGGFAWGTLSYTVSGSIGDLTISGTSGGSFDTINFSDAAASRVLSMFTSVTIRNAFNVNGTATNTITIRGTGFVKAAGTVTCNYVILDSSVVGGGATWNAVNSTTFGTTSGWTMVSNSSNAIRMMI